MVGSMDECILVVDDDREIVKALGILLEGEGYRVLKAYDGLQALDILSSNQVRLVLIDVMMPKLDGIHATLKIREYSSVPIIFLSAKSEDNDKILGLNIGADDYITKPYSVPVLLARIKAVLRRSGNGPEQADLLEAGELRLSLTKGSVSSGGKAAELSRNELQILACLMAHAGQIVSRADLIDALWDNQIYIDDNTLSVNMTRLRGKLAEIGLPDAIKTRRGMGYQL